MSHNFVDDTRCLEKLHKTWVRDTRQDTRHEPETQDKTQDMGLKTQDKTQDMKSSRNETRRDICLETLQHCLKYLLHGVKITFWELNF